ncbi:hypothetical protein TNIN_305271 [Trichonephila inaurata madagascariensis]|uniref:Uncharacterized protein n=1 Tax=Trichonephila inaurata madagascariensis TaxID=2747483 RepID=A0A8X6Y921_9ARAC|nr:hypothetical protein TNIN_305271 [Trichonephila inaurata madagascariensis]
MISRGHALPITGQKDEHPPPPTGVGYSYYFRNYRGALHSFFTDARSTLPNAGLLGWSVLWLLFDELGTPVGEKKNSDGSQTHYFWELLTLSLSGARGGKRRL